MQKQESDLFKLMKSMMTLLTAEQLAETSRNGDERTRAASQTLLEARTKKLMQAMPGGVSMERFLKILCKTNKTENNESGKPDDSGAGDWFNDSDDRKKAMVAQIVIQIASDYFLEQKDSLASQTYMKVAQYVLGRDHHFPQGDNNELGVESPRYRALCEELRQILMKCCIGVSNWSMQSQGRSDSLAWIYEAEILIRNGRYSDRRIVPMPFHDWLQFTGVMLPPYTALCFVEGLIRRAEILNAIGNSSACQHNLTIAGRYLHTLNRHGELGEARKPPPFLLEALDARLKTYKDAILSRRHPDPDSNQRYLIVDPNLQTRGAWKKIPILAGEPAEVTHGTCDYSAFIWKGHIYVARAKLLEKFPKPGPAELRRLSLQQPDKWEFVVFFPTPRGESAINGFCVNGNTLYAFTGHPHLDVLDLTTNKWSTLKTTWKPTPSDRRAGIDSIWPWPGKKCRDAIQVIVDDQLFVFGGMNPKTVIGCNLLMQLDLKTLKWRRLSGLPWVTQFSDPHLPGPRLNSGFWVCEDKKRLYIFSGVCHRALKTQGDKYGPFEDWVYEDLWSWDIKGEAWREEKIHGNPPSPRFGMGSVFSKKLNKALVFGGMNSTCFTIIGESSKSRMYSVSYGDTFMWNPLEVQGGAGCDGKAVPGYWKQIQTVGFPTYRGACHLLVDPDTDDIYLYGGQVQGDTIPSKNRTEVQRRKQQTNEPSFAKSTASFPLGTEYVHEVKGIVYSDDKPFMQQFRDLWKLHIDIPGGNFECIDMEDEIRTAPLGPWHRCFECRKAGFWKKCGGSSVFLTSLGNAEHTLRQVAVMDEHFSAVLGVRQKAGKRIKNSMDAESYRTLLARIEDGVMIMPGLQIGSSGSENCLDGYLKVAITNVLY